MESGTLSEPRFAEVAKSFILFCDIANPAPGRQGHRLRTKLGLTGLPSVAWLDAEGRVVVRVPHDERTVDGILLSAGKARRYVRVRARAAAGDEKAAAAFLILQLEGRQLDLLQARRRRGFIAQLSPAHRVRIDALIRNLEIQATVKAAGRDSEKRQAAGRRFLEQFMNGFQPTDQVTRGFWYTMLEHAEAVRDANGFRLVLDAFRASLRRTEGDKPWVPRLLQTYEKKLTALEKD